MSSKAFLEIIDFQKDWKLDLVSVSSSLKIDETCEGTLSDLIMTNIISHPIKSNHSPLNIHF